MRLLVDGVLVEAFAGWGRGVASVVSSSPATAGGATPSLWVRASAGGVAMRDSTAWRMVSGR